MCHLTFLLDQLIIPPLPAFLPHPWPPHLPPMQQTSNQQPTNQCLDNQFPTIHVPATGTNGLSFFPKPPSPRNNYPFYKKVPIMPLPPNTPPQKLTPLPQNKQLTSYPPKKQMNSDQMSTGSSNKYNNNTTNTATSTPQHKALTELKQDQSRVVLTADKGVAMVIMDQQDYTNKAQTLLQDTNTYKVLPRDPTSYLKNKLITLFKDIKQTGGLSTQKYKQLYPTSAVPPKFYGLPKIHKAGTPLRPIVSSRGSITYGVAKELSHIIKPLVGQPPHHLKNTQHFIQQLQGKKLEPGETITSFDVKALFTSLPVQPSIQIVKQRLQQDNTLPQRTSMSIKQITSLLEFCLSHTYFLFQGKYYEQV